MSPYFIYPPIVAFILAFGSLSTSDRLDSRIAACHETTQSFASLGNEEAFRNIHRDPLPIHQPDLKGKMISFTVADGQDANAYLVESKEKSNEYLFVFHEWYGLNDFVRSQSDIFSEKFADMNIIALDLYDGSVADNRDDARKYMQATTTERALAIIHGAKKLAGKNAQIYTVGWCFGGGWSLQSAIELGVQAKGAVMFYGMPENDSDRLSTLKCDVLAIFASKDLWINQDVANKFKVSMDELPNKLTIKTYEADHGFANPSNPIYDEKVATEAYQEMADFIKSKK